MPAVHSTPPTPGRHVRGVLYARMSTNEQDKSIGQQVQWAEGACAREGVEVVARFVDEGKKGHDTQRRTQFHAMLAYCRDAWQRRQPIDAVVCWHPNRFSRAD